MYPSRANRFAISPPVASPAPMTNTAFFPFIKPPLSCVDEPHCRSLNRLADPIWILASVSSDFFHEFSLTYRLHSGTLNRNKSFLHFVDRSVKGRALEVKTPWRFDGDDKKL